MTINIIDQFGHVVIRRHYNSYVKAKKWMDTLAEKMERLNWTAEVIYD